MSTQSPATSDCSRVDIARPSGHTPPVISSSIFLKYEHGEYECLPSRIRQLNTGEPGQVSKPPVATSTLQPLMKIPHTNSLAILQIDLNTTFTTGCTLGKAGQQVGDVVPRMPVQTGAQSLLVQEMGNQTDAATQDEESVEDTHLQVVFCFLGAESAAVAHQVDEADRDSTVNVEDEIVLLGGGHGFDGNGVIQKLVAWEVLLDELLDELDTQIGVVAGLDSVSNTRD